MFLRNVLDTDFVASIRRDWTAELQRQDFLDENEDWTGREIGEIDEVPVHAALRYEELWALPSTRSVFSLLMDDPIWVFKQVSIRMASPTYGAYLLPPHQDGFYIGPTQEFINVWIPADEMGPETTGGVAVAVGSHKRGLREHVATERLPFKMPALNVLGVPSEDISEPWLTADFRAGDVLFFKPYSIHAALPNRTAKKIRLSMDTRIQPLAAPRGHYALYTALEHKWRVSANSAWPADTPDIIPHTQSKG